LLESWSQIKEDHFNYFDLIDSKYGGESVPKYLIGYSFGGLISTHLLTERPKFFNAASLLAPYYRLYDETLWEPYRKWLNFLTLIAPTAKLIPVPSRQHRVNHLVEFINDPNAIHKGKMPVRNIKVIDELRNKVRTDRVTERIETPFLIISGAEDKMCLP
jgi:pimeloyl-ACP methyl ester carboxylesterase